MDGDHAGASALRDALDKGSERGSLAGGVRRQLWFGTCAGSHDSLCHGHAYTVLVAVSSRGQVQSKSCAVKRANQVFPFDPPSAVLPRQDTSTPRGSAQIWHLHPKHP